MSEKKIKRGLWRIKVWFRRRKIILRQKYNEWRYKEFFDCFSYIDKYFPRHDTKDACEHIKKWADFLRVDASMSEKYRQTSISLKIMLLASGVSNEAIESSDWGDRCLGLNAIDAVVSPDIGNEIVDAIIESEMFYIDSVEGNEGVQVWSANASEQIRSLILEKLFYSKSGSL